MNRQHIALRRWTSLPAAALAFLSLAWLGDENSAANDAPAVKVAEKGKRDLNGDPLPAGALARMGTVRWRHGATVNYVAFTPDGKSVVTSSLDGIQRVWDRATGKELRRFDTRQPAAGGMILEIDGGGQFILGRQPQNAPRTIALSPDGKMLAVPTPDGTIQLYDVATGKTARQIKGPRANYETLAFAPDGKILAARAARATHFFDLESGKELRPSKDNGGVRPPLPIRVGDVVESGGQAFSADGKQYATGEFVVDMQKIKAFIKVTDVATGKELRTIDAMPSGVSALAYSSDGKVLAFSGGTSINLRSADTGEEIRKLECKIGTSALAFNKDNALIAARGRDQIVRVFDAKSGKLLHELGHSAVGQSITTTFVALRGGPLNSLEERDFAFSADGNVIACGDGQIVRFYDVRTGKELALSGGHQGAVTALQFSPDGKTLLSRGADRMVQTWDAATGKMRSQFAEPANTMQVALSPSGALVAFGSNAGATRVMSVSDGKERHSFEGHKKGTAAVAFSPNSKVLATRGNNDNLIRFFDLDKGTELKQITLPSAQMPPGTLIRTGGINVAQGMVFSPDGQTIALFANPGNNFVRGIGGAGAAQTPHAALRIFDISTGKEIRNLPMPLGRTITAITYSPDGRLIASENADQTISLWEIASGKERAVLGEIGPIAQAEPFVILAGGQILGSRQGPSAIPLVFSPDGTLIASRTPGNSVRVWNVNHGKELRKFSGHEGAVQSLAFGPQGKTLASGSSDTTILMWDIASLPRQPVTANLKGADIDTLWTGLVNDNANKAYQSMLTLSSMPTEAVPMLRQHLKPAAPADPKQVEAWINDLANGSFPRRTKATEELERLGDLAAPALAKFLAANPPLEARRRAEPLLEKLATGILTSEQIRMVRAIEALERIGTPEARELLTSLSQGATGALLTRQARIVLDRLPAR